MAEKKIELKDFITLLEHEISLFGAWWQNGVNRGDDAIQRQLTYCEWMEIYCKFHARPVLEYCECGEQGDCNWQEPDERIEWPGTQEQACCEVPGTRDGGTYPPPPVKRGTIGSTPAKRGKGGRFQKKK